MRNVTFIILMITVTCCICIASSTALAQQLSNSTSGPQVSIPPHLTDGPIPGGYITGYVFDEDGKPVPGATVYLWQNDQLWKPGKYQFSSGENPQNSLPKYSTGGGFLEEGGFLFGFTQPGEYILTAEKSGYDSERIDVHVGEDTMKANWLESTDYPVMVNITLSGYHIPVLNSEQESYTGAVAGTLWAAGGYGVSGINVSLWQDGKLVERIDNPQSSFKRNFSGKRIDYMFDHLAPGQYMVMANYYAGANYNDTATVDVGIRPRRADIILSRVLTRPTNFPYVSFTPVIGDFDSLPDSNLNVSTVAEIVTKGDSNAQLNSSLNVTTVPEIDMKYNGGTLPGFSVIGSLLVLGSVVLGLLWRYKE